jgi:hypothetical protein
LKFHFASLIRRARKTRRCVWRSKQIRIRAVFSGLEFQPRILILRVEPIGSARRHYTLARFRKQ